MNQVIAWAGFLGAWLLVAGPLYQGALELDAEEVDREGIQASFASVPQPDRPSSWWWLLPPVMYMIRRHRGNKFRQAVLAQLSLAQRQQFTSFMNKANGWLTVALGAALLAADQTWQVTERYHWETWVFWVLLVVMLGGAVLNTAARMIPDERRAGSRARRADEHSSS